MPPFSHMRLSIPYHGAIAKGSFLSPVWPSTHLLCRRRPAQPLTGGHIHDISPNGKKRVLILHTKPVCSSFDILICAQTYSSEKLKFGCNNKFCFVINQGWKQLISSHCTQRGKAGSTQAHLHKKY